MKTWFCKFRSLRLQVIGFSLGILLLTPPSLAKDIGECVQNSVKLTLKDRLAQTIESRLTASDPWEFSPEAEAKFKGIFENTQVPDAEKPRLLFDALVEARLQTSSPAARLFIRKMAADALQQKSLYSKTVGQWAQLFAGPHYNPVLNRVAITPHGGNDIRDLITAFHEIEHGYDRNANPILTGAMAYAKMKELFMLLRTPITPAAIYRAESRAIGAQWELVQRIPPDKRAILAQGLRSAYLEELVFSLGSRLSRDMSTPDRRKELEKAAGSTAEFVKNATDDEIAAAYETVLDYPPMNLKSHLVKRGQPSAELALASLEYAGLTRDEFLKKMTPLHGYAPKDLLNNHYKVGAWKNYLIGVSLVAIALPFLPSNEDPRKQRREAIDMIPANDVRWITKLYVALFNPGLVQDGVYPVND